MEWRRKNGMGGWSGEEGEPLMYGWVWELGWRNGGECG